MVVARRVRICSMSSSQNFWDSSVAPSRSSCMGWLWRGTVQRGQGKCSGGMGGNSVEGVANAPRETAGGWKVTRRDGSLPPNR